MFDEVQVGSPRNGIPARLLKVIKSYYLRCGVGIKEEHGSKAWLGEPSPPSITDALRSKLGWGATVSGGIQFEGLPIWNGMPKLCPSAAGAQD
jgi:hypothetical protein